VLVVLGIIGFIFPMQGLLSHSILHNIVHPPTGGIALAVDGSEGANRAYARSVKTPNSGFAAR
jgi:hypothetical protein